MPKLVESGLSSRDFEMKVAAASDAKSAPAPASAPAGNAALLEAGQGQSGAGSSGGNGKPLSCSEAFWSLFKSVEEEDTAEHLSYRELFVMFLLFGCRAFGGPVAQIAMMKNELVDGRKWVSNDKFQRVLAVYQVLPGPEATELACYFGYISRGRIGSLLCGVGFILPGFTLMMIAAYVYLHFGIDNVAVKASFTCMQIATTAIIFRSVHKLALGALNDPVTKTFSWAKGKHDGGAGLFVRRLLTVPWWKQLNLAALLYICGPHVTNAVSNPHTPGYIFIFSFLTSVIFLNLFVTMAVCGIMNAVYQSSLPRKHLLGFGVSVMTIFFFGLYCELSGGMPSSGALIGGDLGVEGHGSHPNLGSLFGLGLIAGLVTFGGAYTTCVSGGGRRGVWGGINCVWPFSRAVIVSGGCRRLCGCLHGVQRIPLSHAPSHHRFLFALF